MNHPDPTTQLDAWLDGELPALEAGEVETHLAECAVCARHVEERRRLSAAIQHGAPRRDAPDTLRRRITVGLQQARSADRGSRSPASGWQWLALAASLAVVALGGWQVGLRQATARGLADEVLRSHIRAMQPGHLTDVVSTDQHTVKPWFDGVLDYSPPVYDFSGRDFPLIGGRLDYIGDRAVAALVYGRRKHLITLMVWPADRDTPVAALSRSQQGYHQLHWTTTSYSYWAVSDLGTAELEEFAELVRQADAAAGATRQ